MKRGLIIAGIVVAALVIAVGTVLTIQRVSDDQDTTSAPTPTETPTEEATQPPDIDPDDRETLEALALEAATIMTTWDPNEDFNQTAAELRAADMVTHELADEIVAPERPTTGTEWLEAAEANATSEPTVEVNQGTESEVVSVIATWTWTDPEGQTVSTTDERRAFYFAFEEIDGEILITDYSWESL